MEKRNVPESIIKLVQGQIQSKMNIHRFKLDDIERIEQQLKSEKRLAKEMAQNVIDEINFLRLNGDNYDYFSHVATTEYDFIENNGLQK